MMSGMPRSEENVVILAAALTRASLREHPIAHAEMVDEAFARILNDPLLEGPAKAEAIWGVASEDPLIERRLRAQLDLARQVAELETATLQADDAALADLPHANSMASLWVCPADGLVPDYRWFTHDPTVEEAGSCPTHGVRLVRRPWSAVPTTSPVAENALAR